MNFTLTIHKSTWHGSVLYVMCGDLFVAGIDCAEGTLRRSKSWLNARPDYGFRLDWDTRIEVENEHGQM